MKKRSSLENRQKTFVKIVRRSPLEIPKVVKKKLFVKSPVFDVGKGPVFDVGKGPDFDGGKGPVFDVEIVSTLSPLHNHTSAVALSAVTSH